MSTIFYNRILYANHNIVCDQNVHVLGPDYIVQMQAALTPKGDARLHKAQLDSFNNDGTWTIELPTVDITHAYPHPSGEAFPTRMLATVRLFNGNFNKILFLVECNRNQSFQPLWDTIKKRGFKFTKAQRVEAETAYFKLYDATVAAHKGSK